MKIYDKWKVVKKKTKGIVIVVIAFILAVTIGGILFFTYSAKKKQNNDQPNMTRLENGRITGAGTTATDMMIKQLELDSLETTLYVEEVYVSSGKSVKSKDKLLKLTDESLEKARKELKQKATEAMVAYNEQKLSYEEALIEARKKADIAIVDGKYADDTYALSLEKEMNTLQNLETQMAEALELAEEYYAAVNSDYYYSYYKVAELQERVNEPFAYLMKVYKEWNIEDVENAQGTSILQTLTYDRDKYSLYQQFDAVVSNMMEELEKAKEDYEGAAQKASYSLEAAQADYELANAKYQEAAAALEQTKVCLQTECEVAKADAELAENTYEVEKKQLLETLNKAEDENEIAQENLQIFEQMLGDGYLYADEDGEIMMLNAREGNALDITMPYLVYSDSTHVTVSVSVEQSDIARLSVGDKANVAISGLGNYDGIISSINPVSQSENRSSIYYTVVVTLEGDVSEVTSNLTAMVIFEIENNETGKESAAEPAGQNQDEKVKGKKMEREEK